MTRKPPVKVSAQEAARRRARDAALAGHPIFEAERAERAVENRAAVAEVAALLAA